MDQTINGAQDYATIDQADESVVLKQLQEALQRGKIRRQASPVETPSEMPPAIPPSCLGLAGMTAAQLLAISRKCGEDLECWRSELSAKRKTQPSETATAPSAAAPPTTF